MNKLMGFFELKNLNLPIIPWEEYTGTQSFSEDRLWTIRTALFKGQDQNLPRYIGVDGKKAKECADRLYNEFKDKGIVIFYPYFIAQKSGNLCVNNDKTIIEAVRGDLWNLVTYSKRDVTIVLSGNKIENDGDKDFLDNTELDEILKYIPQIKQEFKEILLEGKNILLEWSFAYDCDSKKNIIGDKYLVFYEARAV